MARSAPTLGMDVETDEPEQEPSRGTLPEFLLGKQGEPVTVRVFKTTDTTRIGIALRPDMPTRAVVASAAAGTPAAETLEGRPVIEPYDELLSVGGVPVESAVHAVTMIREAPAGPVEIEKLPRPEELARSTAVLQRGLRNARARREGLVRRTIHKPQPNDVLGLSFDPEWPDHSVIKMVKEGGLAHGVLETGDVVKMVGGVACDAPAETARRLREAVGHIEVLLVPSARVEWDVLDEERRSLVDERGVGAAAVGGGAGEGEAANDDYDEHDDDDDYEDDEPDFDDDDYSDGGAPAADYGYSGGRGVPPRAANSAAGMDPFPSPARAQGGARRLPPTLGSLSPASECATPPAGGMAPTSTTRSGGPPLAKGRQPQGWRDWLQQRRSVAATVPKPTGDDSHLQQRV